MSAVLPQIRRHPHAFTLVELIAVIVILGVLSTVVLLRVAGNDSRRAEAEARSVQRLLTIAAERDASSPDAQALEFDGASGELRLLSRRAAATPDDRAAAGLQPDPLLPPVFLTRARITQVLVDGRPLPRDRWRIEFSATDGRPAILIDVEATSGQGSAAPGGSAISSEGWRITLGPDEPSAQRVPLRSAAGIAPVVSRAIDLDSAGRGAKPW